MMLSCMLRDARNERSYGTCFWTRMYIATLDAIYEDVKSLTNLVVANTVRVAKSIENI